MSLKPTGIVDFSWSSVSGVEGYQFKVNRNNLFFQNYTVVNQYPSDTSFQISGFIEGDSVGGIAYPFTGENIYQTGISIPNESIDITNFHNSGLLFEFNQIKINNQNTSFSKTQSGYYLTGNYLDGKANIDFSLINPRNSGVIDSFGVEPFLSSIQFKKIYSGNQLYSTENLNSFNYTFNNDTPTRDVRLQIIANDAYGSGITGNIDLNNEPISVKSFSNLSSSLKTGVRTSILPNYSDSATGLDYVVFSGLDRTNYYISGSSTNADSLSFDFPLSTTGFLQLIPYDFFGSGHKYNAPSPIFFDPKDFLDFNKIKNFNHQIDLVFDQHLSIFAKYTENTTSGSYFNFSIDSNSDSSFNSNSYLTGTTGSLSTGIHFDYFSTRTGLHESFYINLNLLQSGTNILEDSKQIETLIPKPSFISSGVNFDYVNGSTNIIFNTNPSFSYTGINIDISGEGSTGFSDFSGNIYSSGDIDVKLGLKLKRISDNFLFDEIIIQESGSQAEVAISAENNTRTDGNISLIITSLKSDVPVESVDIYRKPSYVEVDYDPLQPGSGGLPSSFSGILDFEDYENYVLSTGFLGFQADPEPDDLPLTNSRYEVTGVGFSGAYESGRYFMYRALPSNAYGKSNKVSAVSYSNFPLTTSFSNNLADTNENTNTITSFFDPQTGVVFITGDQTIVGLKHIDNNFHINHTGYIGEDLEVTGDATIGTGQTLFEVNNQGIYSYHTGYFEKDIEVTGSATIGTGETLFEINNQGIYGYNTGYFEKDLNVTGDLTVGTGSSIFEIKEDAVLVNKTGYFKENLIVSGDLNVLGDCNGCGGGEGSTQFLFFGHNAIFTNNFTTYTTVNGSQGGGWLMPFSGKINSFTHQGRISATGNSSLHSANLWLRIYVNDVSQRQVNVHNLSHIGNTGSKVNLGTPVYFSGLDRITVLARTSAYDVEFEDASAILETTVYST